MKYSYSIISLILISTVSSNAMQFQTCERVVEPWNIYKLECKAGPTKSDIRSIAADGNRGKVDIIINKANSVYLEIEKNADTDRATIRSLSITASGIVKIADGYFANLFSYLNKGITLEISKIAGFKWKPEHFKDMEMGSVKELQLDNVAYFNLSILENFYGLQTLKLIGMPVQRFSNTLFDKFFVNGNRDDQLKNLEISCTKFVGFKSWEHLVNDDMFDYLRVITIKNSKLECDSRVAPALNAIRNTKDKYFETFKNVYCRWPSRVNKKSLVEIAGNDDLYNEVISHSPYRNDTFFDNEDGDNGLRSASVLWISLLVTFIIIVIVIVIIFIVFKTRKDKMYSANYRSPSPIEV